MVKTDKQPVCFSDPEVFSGLEKECYMAGTRGTVIDYENFPAAEYRYFSRLCGVYGRFARKEITLDEAKAHKDRLKAEYNSDLAAYLRYSEICKKHQDIVRATNELCIALTKAPIETNAELTEAFRTALAIISLSREEDATEKAVLAKIALP